YGLGIQGSLLQIHTVDANSDIAFGYGSSDPASFKETMRVKGNGSAIVGTGLYLLGRTDGTGSLTKNAFLNSSNGCEIKDPTKKAFTLEGRDSGMLELYGTVTNGKADWRKMATFDAPNNIVDFPNGAVTIAGNLFVKGRLAFYWGPEKQWKQIENRHDNYAGS